MKKHIIILASFAILLFAACDKNKVVAPKFDVAASSQNVKVGEVIKFSFSGNPDFISFYSGEAGHNYANKSRSSVTGKPQLQFSTFAQNNGAQANSLNVLVSTNFKGVYTSDGIAAATWADITSKAVLSTGADNVQSGLIDVSGVMPDNQPVYIAFKKHDNNSATLKPWGWTIRSFQLDYLSTSDNTTYNVTTLANAGWTAVDVLNPTYKWTVSSTALTIGGGTLNTAENEDWVITKVLYPNQVNADVGVAIKTVDVRLDSYTYKFATAGTYHIVFVGLNANQSDQKEVVKSFDITVTN